jgi:stage IV sporulation protein FB
VLAFHEPPRTGFELGWSLFGIRVRISPTFFLVAGLLAYLFVGPNLVLIAVDVACILFATLFTEVAQAVVYRSYGVRAAVVIQDFGGGVYPETEPPLTIQRVVAALSAPASSFLLYAVVYYSNQEYHWSNSHPPYTFWTYYILWIVSLFWGIIGLLPIFPYPGGRAMGEVLSSLFGRAGIMLTLVISIAVGIAYIAYFVLTRFGHMAPIPLPGGEFLPASIFVAVFFAIATIRNFQLLQMLRAQGRRYEADDYGERAPWDR